MNYNKSFKSNDGLNWNYIKEIIPELFFTITIFGGFYFLIEGLLSSITTLIIIGIVCISVGIIVGCIVILIKKKHSKHNLKIENIKDEKNERKIGPHSLKILILL